MFHIINNTVDREEEKKVQDIKGDCIIHLSNIINKVSDLGDEEVENYVIE